MKFWDSSGLVPLLLVEPSSETANEVLAEESAMVVWWATRLECISALVRRSREGVLDANGEEVARLALGKLATAWTEVRPTQAVRDVAERLLAVHRLGAADAFQLAAALIWAKNIPARHGFVCLDGGLRAAAGKEGFTLFPREIR